MLGLWATIVRKLRKAKSVKFAETNNTNGTRLRLFFLLKVQQNQVLEVQEESALWRGETQPSLPTSSFESELITFNLMW
jgi:hypothetical protein